MADTVRTPDFKSFYANNVRFESTVFDLRLFFGELDHREDESWIISQKASVVMAWSQAKIAALFLLVNVMAHEQQNGPVDLPANLLPPWLLPEDSELSLEELVGTVADKFNSFVAQQQEQQK
ncbi:MAG TPA: DUF3467 domain-containing protein [Terriglobales bacterium]|nr:DUF3467 domain-containing protein [Terriglobales bacterium]